MYSPEFTSQLVGRLHQAICQEIEVSIESFSVDGSNFSKNIALFVLDAFYGYQKKHIAVFYKIHDLYVSYCVNKMIEIYVSSVVFQKMIIRIVNVCDGFEKMD
jgi:hypothetical protein